MSVIQAADLLMERFGTSWTIGQMMVQRFFAFMYGPLFSLAFRNKKQCLKPKKPPVDIKNTFCKNKCQHTHTHINPSNLLYCTCTINECTVENLHKQTRTKYSKGDIKLKNKFHRSYTTHGDPQIKSNCGRFRN